MQHGKCLTYSFTGGDLPPTFNVLSVWRAGPILPGEKEQWLKRPLRLTKPTDGLASI